MAGGKEGWVWQVYTPHNDPGGGTGRSRRLSGRSGPRGGNFKISVLFSFMQHPQLENAIFLSTVGAMDLMFELYQRFSTVIHQLIWG